ncbi:glycoside hydrolase family 18 protein [Solitalea lacus]|uniref:glycoside hydrolase family 18 protein n=1 Tax=Solitalea lacus TaxID=2911172 RepID=UPI001EDC5488|nr:glycoside hydrolase family 18 protein [Solitalea lacus]UKJ08884.1 glycoside hydrolase family 18 protein [Solitalea lacus]
MSLFKFKSIVLITVLTALTFKVNAQANKFQVIAYFFGGTEQAKTVPANKLTHVIFSFCHLKGNKLNVDKAADTATIQQLVALKKINPKLKVLLSLGGWGGCETCSNVFSTNEGRGEFAKSVKHLNDYFKTDGIDLDWEYPAIEGYPGHKYKPEDKANFTALVAELRKKLGKKQLITFATGGFQKCLEESIDWKGVISKVDYINLMSYDLVNGDSFVTGHHTALYSTQSQKESTDNAVSYLLKQGVPSSQIVIGAAFYGRVWENVPNVNNGLYQSGKFKYGLDYGKIVEEIPKQTDFVYYWDEIAKAPFYYSADKKLFLTYDDKKSIELKTKYVMDKKLGGIMFWEICNDAKTDGLLDKIDDVKRKASK